jgi:glycosyltransferase involved in cell wall biosynthesis
MERWALSRAAMVTVNSTAALGFVASYYGVPSGKMRFVPNGVEPLGDRLPGKREAREQLGLHPTAPVLLGLFRLSPEKELGLFCGVAEAAFEGISEGHCLIAGDGPERARLQERVASSSRPELFSLLGARDDVPRLLAAADMLMITSRSEGMPNSVLEAMSAGLPVVATRVGGLPDIVEQGATGHLREAGDREGLAAACRELLANKEIRTVMGQRAKAAAEQSFSVECMVAAYERIYGELLGGVAHA